MTGCWSGKVAGHCLNILIFISFIIEFNIIYIMRTKVDSGRIQHSVAVIAVIAVIRHCVPLATDSSCKIIYEFVHNATH